MASVKIRVPFVETNYGYVTVTVPEDWKEMDIDLYEAASIEISKAYNVYVDNTDVELLVDEAKEINSETND